MAMGSGAYANGTGTVALGGLGGTKGGSVANQNFAVAIGAAAVVGFVLARMFKSGNDEA